MRVRSIRVLVLAVLLAGCGGARSSPESPTISPSPYRTDPSMPAPSDSTASSADDSLVPALTVDDPQVRVAPSDHLADGQTVQVSVTGFGVGGIVRISECATASTANDLGCGLELAAQTILVTDDGRVGAAPFTVHARARAGPGVAAIEPCTDRCLIVATLGPGFGFADATVRFGRP
jgi:hypothetical protein